MAKEKIVLAELDLDVEGLIEAADDSKKAIKELKKAIEKCKKAGKEFSSEYRNLEKELAKVTKAYQAQKAAINVQVNVQQTLISGQNNIVIAQQNIANATKEATDKTKEQNKTFNDFKGQLVKGVQDLNIFNGGLSGLISRMDKAGGAGPLVAGSFKNISEGIGGMTKSSLAFIATPMGAVIAAIGLVLNSVISYLKDTQGGIDKVTAVTRPLQSIFQALVGLFQKVGENLFSAFTNPRQALTDLYEFVKQNLINRFTAFGKILEGIMEMDLKKIADGSIQAATGVEGAIDKVKGIAQETGKFFEDAANKGKRIDDLQKELDKSKVQHIKRTGELGRALDENNRIANDADLPIAERQKAALKAIDNAKEQNKLMDQRLEKEIELLRLKLTEGGLTDAEKAELEEMVQKRKDAAAQAANQERELVGQVNTIRNEGAAKEKERKRKAVEDSIAKEKQELELLQAKSNNENSSLQESIANEEEFSRRRLAILKKEFDNKLISQQQYDKSFLDENNALNQKLTQHAIRHGAAALNLEIQQNQVRINNQKELTQEFINEQAVILEGIRDKKIAQLELEKGTNDEIIAQKKANNEELSINDIDFLTSKSKIEEEFRQQNDDNDKAFKAQVKEREAQQKAADDMAKVAAADNEYQEKLILEEIRHQEEMASIEKMNEDKLLSEEQYQALVKDAEQKTANIKKELAIQNAKTQLGTMQNVASALTEAFGQSKELAVAQATMNAGQAILSIWSGDISGNPLIDAAIKAALTASTAVSTAKQIKKITSAKKPKEPKFEKGGLIGIGGKRHSAGGTMFTGEDGTAFEAEQGELIGVMNRNAARHFMAFNNAFPAGAGSAPNYFASGGIVSRDIASPSLNADELALKISDANRSLPQPVVAVQDIVTEGNSFVQVRQGADF